MVSRIFLICQIYVLNGQCDLQRRLSSYLSAKSELQNMQPIFVTWEVVLLSQPVLYQRNEYDFRFFHIGCTCVAVFCERCRTAPHLV